MQTILVTYLMIGPCGATMSLDALRKRYRAARMLLSSGGKPVTWAENALAGPPASWLGNFAIRLFQINFCFIYASSGFSKLKGSTWWDPSAPWLVAVNPEFGLVRYRIFEWLLRQMSESRMVIALTTGSLSLFTLVMEIGLPFLIWTRLRPVMVIGSTLLHLGIAIMMGLTVFSMYMFTLVLCHIPAKLIRDRVVGQPGSGQKMTVLRQPRSCGRAKGRSDTVAGCHTPGHVRRSGRQGSVFGDGALIDAEGKQTVGEELFHTALRELVLVRPLGFSAISLACGLALMAGLTSLKMIRTEAVQANVRAIRQLSLLR